MTRPAPDSLHADPGNSSRPRFGRKAPASACRRALVSGPGESGGPPGGGGGRGGRGGGRGGGGGPGGADEVEEVVAVEGVADLLGGIPERGLEALDRTPTTLDVGVVG